MNHRFSLNIRFKEAIIFFASVFLITVLSKWTYFFLPDEYAEKAQFPNMEQIFTACIALLFMFIYKIVTEINEIKKQLMAQKRPSDANPHEGSK